MPRPEVDAFRNSVAILCAELGNIQEIANQAEISRVFLSRIIHGHATPTLETAAKIADALGKPLSALVKTEPQKNLRRPA